MGGHAKLPGEGIKRVFTDAAGNAGLDDSGYVVKISAGLLSKCANAEVPYGIASTDTKNVLYDGTSKFTQYLINPEINVIFDGIIDVKVAAAGARTTAIAIGDKVEVAAGGVIIHDTDGASVVIGTAEEALGDTVEPTDGDQKILVRVHIPFV